MTVKTMELEQPTSLADVGAKQWQQTEKAAKAATASGRKLVLASVGAGAYVLDGVVAVYQRGERLLNQAERRGAKMEREARQRFGKLEEQAVGEMRKLQGQAEESLDLLRESRGGANEEIEKRIELALANMGLPSRERLERLSQEIDALNQKLDEQLLRLPSEPLPDPLG